MSAGITGEEGMTPTDSYDEITGLVTRRLAEAVALDLEHDRYEYYAWDDTRPGAVHSLAVICVANSVEPFRSRRVEQLQLHVPLARTTTIEPVSALGNDADYFYLTYLDDTGAQQTLRVDPPTYASRFEVEEPQKPPVSELAHKLFTYAVIPMRLRQQDHP